MQLGEGLVYRRLKAGCLARGYSESDLLSRRRAGEPPRYRAVSDRKEPEVSIKPAPQSPASRGDRAAGSAPAAARGGTQLPLLLTHPLQGILEAEQTAPREVAGPGRCGQALCEETSSPPSCGEPGEAHPETKLPAKRRPTRRSSEHPPPPAPSCFSTGPFTLVAGDVTAVAWPSCQQRQEETKLPKKFPDFAAPHGSPRLSSPPP